MTKLPEDIDLVEVLRGFSILIPPSTMVEMIQLMQDAADEIERLRALQK